MPKGSPRPSRQAYNNYDGVLGKVIGQSKQREKNGALLYKVLCIDCGEIHLRNAKHLKQGLKTMACKEYKPPNYSGLEKRDGIIRRQYGITLDQYNKMLKAQNNKCAICGNEDEVEGRKLAIDHCHNKGHVRGLLCGKCNRGLGLFYDNPELLQNAINYLAR
jgi:hypothetical protein